MQAVPPFRASEPVGCLPNGLVIDCVYMLRGLNAGHRRAFNEQTNSWQKTEGAVKVLECIPLTPIEAVEHGAVRRNFLWSRLALPTPRQPQRTLLRRAVPWCRTSTIAQGSLTASCSIP